MDQQFLELLGPLEDKSPSVLASKVRFKDEDSSEVQINGADGAREYRLRALDDLFGKGRGSETINIQDERFHPLLMTIEHAIVEHFEQNPAMTDGQVSLTLRSLGMNPAANSTDPLSRRIERDLRVFLSVHDWSRQEVKLGLRKVLQSVERHTKLAGVRGYLSFIVKYVPY